MRSLLTVAFFVFFALSSVVFFVGALVVFAVTAPFDGARRVNHLYSCAWATLYAVATPGWRLRTTGRHHIATKTPYVLVANHSSIADIVLMFGLFRQFKWLSKEEVFRYPILGWNMRLCRYIPLVRGNRESIRSAMASCRSWLQRGISIMMFPEGTRSADGRLQPFKRGAFDLAMECGVAVVPIAIHGGRDLIPKHGRVLAHRADLWVEVLPAVSPSGFTDAESLSSHVRGLIEAALSAHLEPQRDRRERNAAAGLGCLVSARPGEEIEPYATEESKAVRSKGA